MCSVAQYPSCFLTADSLGLFCNSTVRVTSWWPPAARWCQKPSWRSTADSLVLACSFTVRVTSWWPRLMVTL